MEKGNSGNKDGLFSKVLNRICELFLVQLIVFEFWLFVCFLNHFHAIMGCGEDPQTKCQNTLKRLYTLLAWERDIKEKSQKSFLSCDFLFRSVISEQDFSTV